MTEDSAGPTLDRERLEAALDAAGLGEFEWDLVRDLLRVSKRMSAITGRPAGEFPARAGAELLSIVHPDDRQRVHDLGEVQLNDHDTYDIDYRIIRPDDGRTVWLRSSAARIRDQSGKPVAICGIVRDTTESRATEDQRRTLMSELDHRVKNVLAAVQALATQTAKRTTSLESFLTTFGGRLKSMASANELLTAARWRGAAIGHLAAAELGGIAPGQTRWDGPELFLTPRAANALSLALHELATNALKFGALSTETGRVDVRWSRTPDGGFDLVWSESGGPMVTPPAHLGFGSTLLGQVTGRELNGHAGIEFRSSGVRARLHAGAQAIVERPETVPDAPAARVAEPVPAANGRTDLKGARVLIVEDAVLLALELETGLSDAGAKVIGPAYELEEAMALLDQEIDAAVLDANLNGRSVTPVAEVLASRGIPFVFATGYGEAGGAPSGFDAPIIRKPYDVTQVAAAVAGVLGLG
ncbi:MAG TPA: HWE histidine kinase domain-containing protein [Phenylobacterium sp.]|nr:HWE histidine kinase domain-containing protein [Phenylobacterium sp.]